MPNPGPQLAPRGGFAHIVVPDEGRHQTARLPDELETSILIQQKIDDYYARGGQ